MLAGKSVKWVLLLLLISISVLDLSSSEQHPRWAAKRRRMREKVRRMFYHAYDNYMNYAFPHDELKPLTKTFTDSLSELGNLKLEHLPHDYNGSALTLIESLSSNLMQENFFDSLVIMGNNTEFERAVIWLSENLKFDVDARINLFECNIRVLGGLVSAHLLATDSTSRLVQGAYKNQLLILAEDLGKRFLPAFDTPTGLPYAWINLKYGVMENETTETSTSGCGSLILEMGALSRLTGDPRYESAALHALRKLWSMRSSLNLFGTTLDVVTGDWIEYSSGIGAGVDSFYEYLFKAHIIFGKEEFWRMFHSAYVAVQKYFRHGPWYHEADMRTGKATYWQLTSLQAFWPGLQASNWRPYTIPNDGLKPQKELSDLFNTKFGHQVLVGDVAAANASHREFFYVWEKFGVLPERYLLDHQILHPTEKYYPLRPELAESTFYLYQATKDPWYIEVGESIVNSLNSYTKVEGGFASIRDVTTMQLEDHQHSFFLAETCKYLFLLFDDSFLVDQNYIFTTEGHPLPVLSAWHERLPEAYIPTNWTFVKKEKQVMRASAMSLQVCPATVLNTREHGNQQVESACHVADIHGDHRCLSDEDCGVDSTTCRRRSCSIAARVVRRANGGSSRNPLLSHFSLHAVPTSTWLHLFSSGAWSSTMALRLLLLFGFLLLSFREVSSDPKLEKGQSLLGQLVLRGGNRKSVQDIDCGRLCKERCSLNSRPNRCHRACGSCCAKCKCVPPGTFGNRELCGKCYTDMTTHHNQTKCP
ncbi:Glycoside hydrolase [Parasponia andersonii]|uniref:alpha-1,2-Mannosidase n=1 Tax=Parasponia andersonii TaxID=3476 RepID=A0A2P5CJ33_PARAD|nr:Glycoside hydrolase [Parasponia andersonii]